MSISVFYNNNFDHPIIFLRSKKVMILMQFFFFNFDTLVFLLVKTNL